MNIVGSAAALAGYDWLDFLIGTDSKWLALILTDLFRDRLLIMVYQAFGSITVPASAAGLFQLRYTLGI